MDDNLYYPALLSCQKDDGDKNDSEEVQIQFSPNPLGLKLRYAEGIERNVTFSQILTKEKTKHGFKLTFYLEDKQSSLLIKGEDGLTRLFKFASDDLREEIREYLERSVPISRVIWQGAVILLLLCSFGWGLYKGATAVGRRALLEMPSAWEIKLGSLAFETMPDKLSKVDDPLLNQMVKELADPLIESLGNVPYEFKFHVIASSTVNALSLPGGNIIIYTGLIEQAESPEELAGILAHEISHVTNRHSLQALGNQLGSYLFFMILPTITGDFDYGISSLAPRFADLSFSRTQEEEADAEGLKLLAKAGFEREGMFTFFRRMSEKEGRLGDVMSLVATHPGSKERLTRLQELSAEIVGDAKERPKYSFVWDEVKSKAKELQEGAVRFL